MNGKDLLSGMNYVNSKYIEEAETAVFEEHRRLSLKRPLLIAAIVAMMLLLVGCAVVYALRLQDMSIGQETYTQSFDDQGKAIEPIEKTRDILTLYGHSGDAIQLALTEWYEFLATYDPDGELMDDNPDHPEIPNQYEYTYGCYTQDMVNKVNEIAEKHNLKLLEEWIPFQQYQSDIFLEESGIGSFLLPDCGAEVTHLAGMYYPPYNFDMDFELSTDKLEGKLWVTALYARKDYFPKNIPGGMDLSLYEQWDYTSSDGTALLLALSSKGQGFIIAEPDNAMLIYSIDGNFSGSAYPTANEIMTKAQLESVASLFDYSIKPEILDCTAVEQKLEEAQETYDAGHTYEPKTYGSFVDYLTMTYTFPSEELQYTFYDLTGDGEEELLIGENGTYSYWVTLRDGETLEQINMHTYLCENGVEERYSAWEIYETHIYVAPLSESAIDDIDAERTVLTVLKREKDQWTQGPNDFEQTPITEAEAQAVMAQYQRIELSWNPLLDYPLSETQTLRDYLEAKDVRVSSEELREIYANYLNSKDDIHYSHYRILDINGDGVDDLLLKGEDDAFIGNTDYYWMAMTYRYGRTKSIASDFYLCEDGILESVDARNDEGAEMTGHEFIRYNGFTKEVLGFTVYNKATDSWQSDWYGTSMDTAAAEAILAKYPRIDQGMRPISELLN